MKIYKCLHPTLMYKQVSRKFASCKCVHTCTCRNYYFWYEFLSMNLDKPPSFGPCKILDFELEMVRCWLFYNIQIYPSERDIYIIVYHALYLLYIYIKLTLLSTHSLLDLETIKGSQFLFKKYHAWYLILIICCQGTSHVFQYNAIYCFNFHS